MRNPGELRRQTFFLHGFAVGRGTNRQLAVRNGKPFMYEPEAQKNWKNNVRLQALKHKPRYLRQGPIALRLVFFLLRPKSLPKKVRFHIKKPDLTNLAKHIEDAMKGVHYRDDSQIVDLSLTKYYCDETEMPGIKVEITELEAP